MRDLLDRREVGAIVAALGCLDHEDLKAKQGSLVSKAWMVEMACLGSRGWTGSTAGMVWTGSLDLTVFQARLVLQGCQGRTENTETRGGQELKALWDQGGRGGCLVQGAVQELMACMGSKVSLIKYWRGMTMLTVLTMMTMLTMMLKVSPECARGRWLGRAARRRGCSYLPPSATVGWVGPGRTWRRSSCS